MAYKFGFRSTERLKECDYRLQLILNEAIKLYDFTILCGHRNKQAQDEAYKTGKSKLRWPYSKHNRTPAVAVDIAPYPLNWNDRQSFIYLGGIMKGIAHSMGITLRWGGDFNMNNDLSDQAFSDLPHFELME